MNPYTYSRGGQVSSPANDRGFFHTVFTAKVSSLMAFAIILLAAGSAAAITPAAMAEVNNSQEYALSMTTEPVHHPEVLGESIVVTPTSVTINDSELEAAEPTGDVSVKPAGFDATVGRWNYKISYKVANVTNAVKLTIGNYVVMDNVTGSGDVETGAILKPSMSYRLSLWTTDSSGNKQILARAEIKTAKGKALANKEDSSKVCPPSQNGNTSTPTSAMLCVKNVDGKVSCDRQICLPPPVRSTTTPPTMKSNR